MNLNDLRMQVQQQLVNAGIADADIETRHLLTAVLGVDRLNTTVTFEQHQRISAMAVRRAAREPLDRIIGQRGFYGLEFALNHATLSPRPDTETLVDAALAFRPARILDIGTGSGCIALALLHQLPQATAVATDISAAALTQAKANAAALGLDKRVQFVETCYADGITGPFDVIVSNPPYIPTAAIDTLAAEVKQHDPLLALDGGVDGLDAYRALLSCCASLLTPGGVLLLEIGAGQGPDVSALALAAGWTAGQSHTDLGGIIRVLTFFR